ncbi:tetratricopeptide repeat protein [Massilia sp. DD77]|uniref:tetratricopeptide repeat protein n=1 Tax=Massilia sp. DD77 TaxID=3109349 RepID=UPI0030003CA6
MTSCTAKRNNVLAAALALAFTLAPGAARADYAAEAARLKNAPAKDATMHVLQAGVAAMAEGKTQDANGLFDNALDSIEGMFANTENAAKARSLWYEEGAKDYKGEPYERAMAYYYRGLLYLAEGDYENARASFRGGILQDAFAEEQQFRSDFAALMILEGWSSQLNGDKDLARETYAEVARLRPQWAAPAAGANLLVVAELGGAPRKVGDGIGNHEIVYRPAKRMPERSLKIEFDGKPQQVALAEDVFYQASTRGGRPVDRLIEGKVAFQNTTGAIGEALGTIASDGSVYAAAAGGGGGRALGAVAAVGAIFSMVSVNVKPRADVRYWNNLPETLHIGTVNYQGLPGNVNVTLFDDKGQQVPADTLRIQKWIDKKGNGVVWIKTRNH